MAGKRSIYSNRCWLDGKLQPATICFEHSLITELFTGKTEGAEDAGDNILMPGIIDAHVHINEPGRTDWEGFDTGTQAAAAGGITTIADMPLNASPVTTNVNAFNEKLHESKDKLHVNVGFYGGLIPGNQNDLEGLIQAGVLGIKCFLTHSGIDEFPNVTEKELDAAMPVIAKYHIPLLLHCELEGERTDQLMKYPTSYAAYLASRPKAWENEAVDLVIKLCRKHRCATHIVHVSSAEALGKIQKAKQEGLPLTAETCAHYIYFNAENIPDADCLYKCAPPIREKENNELLKKALKDGVLDFIATDHSPAPPAIKELESGNLQKAWGGIAGLQFLLPVAWTAMKETISLEKFIPLLTEHPAAFLQTDHRKGKLAVGYDADLVVWNPEERYEVKTEDILHRHNCSPYTGQRLYGTVQQTIINGMTVYGNKKIIQKNAGQWLLRK
ncbi:MAG: allantoinase AllB [Chitinophagaceae bacterium]|nr:allantoinase AllB [Chitinophagaceae bacterium]